MKKILFGAAGFATALVVIAIGIVVAAVPTERGLDSFELDNS